MHKILVKTHSSNLHGHFGHFEAKLFFKCTILLSQSSVLILCSIYGVHPQRALVMHPGRPSEARLGGVHS